LEAAVTWLGFFASVIGSLAWPVIVALVLYLLRHTISPAFESLVGRLSKVTIQGGTAVEFGKELAEARDKGDEAAVRMAATKPEQLPRPHLVPEPITPNDPFVALAKLSPPAAIVEAFKEVERVLIDNDWLLSDTGSMPAKRAGGLIEIVRDLNRAELIPGEVVEQFQRVRQLRNLAAHPTGQSDLSVGSAVEYRELCRFLVTAFSFAFARLQTLRGA
jgi:hypothetical protein